MYWLMDEFETQKADNHLNDGGQKRKVNNIEKCFRMVS